MLACPWAALLWLALGSTNLCTRFVASARVSDDNDNGDDILAGDDDDPLSADWAPADGSHLERTANETPFVPTVCHNFGKWIGGLLGSCRTFLKSNKATHLFPWVAVIVAWLAHASASAPMKFTAVIDADVHPMVFQLHCAFWMFVASHASLSFVPYRLSWWGLLSGVCWVFAELASKIAIRHLGIASGRDVWQGLSMSAAFVWGHFGLQDHTIREHAFLSAVIALLCMNGGVLGMTGAFNITLPKQKPPRPVVTKFVISPRGLGSYNEGEAGGSTSSSSTDVPFTVLQRRTLGDIRYPCVEVYSKAESRSAGVGIATAIFSAFVLPVSYAPKGCMGFGFAMSYATGAVLVNVALFTAFAALSVCWWKQGMPPMQFRVMLVPGILCGTFQGLACFCSLYAIGELGFAIGYPLVQSSAAVSGLWGIFYFRELGGSGAAWPLCRWLLSCCVFLGGSTYLALLRA